MQWKDISGIQVATVAGSLEIVRADPALTPLELVNPPESNGSVARLGAARGWLAGINAAMFARDYVTSIGYMRNFENVNNPNVSAKLQGFLMFNPKDPRDPSVRIAGKRESDSYNTVFQTHRMIDGKNNILWKKGASVYRQVGLVGVDDKHRVLFFHHPRMIDVHDLVAKILALKLELRGLLYLDGGSHGVFYLAPALGRGVNTWIPLPNVLGIKPAP